MIILSIRSFFLAARGMNPEGLPFFINPSVLWTPPLYFALQNTEEEGESNPPLIAVRCSAYGTWKGEEGNTSFGNEVGYRSFFFAVL